MVIPAKDDRFVPVDGAGASVRCEPSAHPMKAPFGVAGDARGPQGVPCGSGIMAMPFPLPSSGTAWLFPCQSGPCTDGMVMKPGKDGALMEASGIFHGTDGPDAGALSSALASRPGSRGASIRARWRNARFFAISPRNCCLFADNRLTLPRAKGKKRGISRRAAMSSRRSGTGRLSRACQRKDRREGLPARTVSLFLTAHEPLLEKE